MKQLGDPLKTSVKRHCKLGNMVVSREFRLVDGKQGRQADKKAIKDGLETMTEVPAYGIAFVVDGEIVGWKTSPKTGKHLVWDSLAAALEENDLGGWTGYVRCYPGGENPHGKEG